MLPLLPLWLDEGLAEYFEVPSRSSRRDGNPYLRDVIRQARRASVPRWSGWKRYATSANSARVSTRTPGLTCISCSTDRHRLAVLCWHIWPTSAGTVLPEPISASLDRGLGDTPQAFVQHFRQWHR